MPIFNTSRHISVQIAFLSLWQIYLFPPHFFPFYIDIFGVSLHWNWNVHQTKNIPFERKRIGWRVLSVPKCGRWIKGSVFLRVYQKHISMLSLRMTKKRQVILFIFCAVTFHMDKHRYQWTSFWWVSKRMNLVYTKWFCTQWGSKKGYPLYYVSLFFFCTLLYYTEKLESHFNFAIHWDYVDLWSAWQWNGFAL